jgi:hypothetical protein
VGILKGFPKSVGRVESRLYGFPCFPYSVISMACLRAGSECEVAEIPVYREPRELLLIGRVLREALIADRRGAEVL